MSTTDRPAVGVAVIIRRGRELLLGWRVAGHSAGCWQLPGGHLEYGEDIVACGLREVYEESGLQLVRARSGPYTNDIFAAEGRHYITLYVIADYAGGAPIAREPTKCARWQWFKWDALPTPLFLPLQNLRYLSQIMLDSSDEEESA
jgi:8-oxo-dGTP diphosphatase